MFPAADEESRWDGDVSASLMFHNPIKSHLFSFISLREKCYVSSLAPMAFSSFDKLQLPVSLTYKNLIGASVLNIYFHLCKNDKKLNLL